ncbi:hypothetical protein Tco_0856553 [Tanacetum coccineum]|uniref:Uncharacterized protein n=1 Tax=Tanacetum coccineum TaxID=301880 RepID=A0ABQ5B7N0_9ASTR
MLGGGDELRDSRDQRGRLVFKGWLSKGTGGGGDIEDIARGMDIYSSWGDTVMSGYSGDDMGGVWRCDSGDEELVGEWVDSWEDIYLEIGSRYYGVVSDYLSGVGYRDLVVWGLAEYIYVRDFSVRGGSMTRLGFVSGCITSCQSVGACMYPAGPRGGVDTFWMGWVGGGGVFGGGVWCGGVVGGVVWWVVYSVWLMRGRLTLIRRECTRMEYALVVRFWGLGWFVGGRKGDDRLGVTDAHAWWEVLCVAPCGGGEGIMCFIWGVAKWGLVWVLDGFGAMGEDWGGRGVSGGCVYWGVWCGVPLSMSDVVRRSGGGMVYFVDGARADGVETNLMTDFVRIALLKLEIHSLMIQT